MAKAPKRAFVCNECGADYPRWQGQCSACHAWNTITEVRIAASPQVARNERLTGYAGNAGASKVQKLSEISLEALPRFSTGFKEFDRVLGGGVVPGSAILIGGSPGAGKSTLLLQTLCRLSENMKTLYVTGEESLQQVAMRAHRLGLPTANLNMLSETSIEQICQIADDEKPQLMVIDSIQVMHMADVQSSPGSVAQVRETAAYLTRFAKTRDVAIIMVGHVTKDGSLAGPKVLEHCIDCSVLLDGDADSRFRTLRSHKNRFGAVNELGVFAMTEQGLREISNPSAIFLSRGDEVTSGSSVMVVWEGTRPLLVEIQALVDHSMMSNPRRVAVGLEQNRLAILLAVLHRHGGLQMADQDVFVNVVGGVKVAETSADLALLLAMAVCALLAMAVERFAYRRLRNAPRLAPLISGIGVSVLLQTVAMIVWSRNPLMFPQILPMDPIAVTRGSEAHPPALITVTGIVTVTLALAVMLGLWLLVEYTRLGRGMRAVAENPRIATLMGVNPNAIIIITFAIGGVFAALAGVMMASNYGSASFSMGFLPGIKAFTAAVLGGIGNIRGAMVGGLLLGLIESLGAGYLGDLTNGVFGSNYQDIFAFMVLILVLVFRPAGLLGERVAHRA